MKRKILIPIGGEDEAPPRPATYYPITRTKAIEAARFTTEPMRAALESFNRAEPFTMSNPRQTTLLRMWEDGDAHRNMALDHPITLFTQSDSHEWIEQEKCFGVLEVRDRTPLGLFIRGGAQAPFHGPQVIVRALAPSVAQSWIENIHPDDEAPIWDHGFLAFLAWRITMTLTMDERDTAGFVFNVKSDTDWDEFLHRPRDSDPFTIRLYTHGATGESKPENHAALTNRIWRQSENPIDFEEPDDLDGFGAILGEHRRGLPPIYKERRTSLHINLGGDFWVEETRCPNCAQRLIIHAPASMCPSGRPVGLTVKCGDCKHSFGWP
jgi:hypothetical protein